MNSTKYFLLICLASALIGCDRSSPKVDAGAGEVMIYVSIDEPYAAPLFKRFEEKTGIKVHWEPDTEATKTAKLVERLEAEKDHPRADVYWGNEIFHTINLAEHGLFSPYRPKTAEDVPTQWRDKEDRYLCIGLRARSLIFSTRPEAVGLTGNLQSIHDLTNPSLKGKIGICHPAFGTASGHVAALYELWGRDRFMQFMHGLRANEVKLLGGNSAVADQVAAGNLYAGLTDTDDVANGKAEGQLLDGRLPDQQADQSGTLLIPGTMALIKNAPHEANARKLIDFLCDPAIEKELIAGRYLAYSVRDTSKVKAMEVDYMKCAHTMRTAVETALTILQDRTGQ